MNQNTQPDDTSSKLEEILLRENYVTVQDLAKAQEWAKNNHSTVIKYLLENEIITRDLLGRAIAESFNVAYADLATNAPSAQQVQALPEEIARKYHIALFKWDEQSVTVVTDNPQQSGLTDLLSRLYPKLRVELAYSFSEDINSAFIHYQKPLETRFSKIVEGGVRIAPEILEEIFNDAITFRSSDIHFEPQEKEIIIRFRVDGVLHEAGRISRDLYQNILNRIKVQAHMRIDEHASSQDGALRYPRDDGVVDMRVSIAPTLDGEKIAIRLLAEYTKNITFDDLGLSEGAQTIIKTVIQKPFGMILVTGPTGSGKTTTLYALLKTLNRPGINITTIEDPVEYKITGLNQIQVNPQTNLTFAKGLRSIIRQDPDIILVGEIRDIETMEIAVNAALVGHLLFSSFHATDSSVAIPRLLDMGVEPFLLASTLEFIISQRLVRRICESCRFSYKTETSSYFSSPTTLYKGKGCKACGNAGYKGRTAIFEYIEITSEMEDLMLKNPSSQQVWELARREGAHSLFEDGIEKVKNGITTLEELLRVAAPPKI